ncbi:hypothetical protein [Bdellovibrio bacteriovorus]|uniref:hypothetical protein n=1 Tax=Bdellovibrio TaxID=958 RepID=UPI0035A9A5AD
MIRSLAIQFIFLSLTFFLGVQAQAVETCGAQTCGEGYQCNAKGNSFATTVYRCVPIPGFDMAASRAKNACEAECQREGYSCQADNQERTSYSCRVIAGSPQDNDNQCVGPCQNGRPGMVNGRCDCIPDNAQNQNQGATCQQQFEQIRQRCGTQQSDTAYTCDEKNDSGMSSVTDTAAQLALMMGQQTSASIQAACSKMADFTQAANGALAAYRLTCSNSINSCKSACTEAKTYLNQNQQCLTGGNQLTYSNLMTSVDNDIKVCNNYNSKVNEAQQAIQNYGATSANASQCASLTEGTGSAPVTEFCKANPTHVSCAGVAAVDCTNPTQATTNKVCVCTKNPNDPMCSNSQKAGGSDAASIAGGSIDPASRLAKGSDNVDLGGDVPGLPLPSPGASSSGSSQGVDGSQGGGTVGGGSGGGSGGSASSGGGGGGSANENGANVNGGFYGGGGGGGKFGGGYGGGGDGSGARGVAGGAGGIPGAQGGPDLRKFLPGGQYDPKRGLSGMSGTDGITGPHSNIWQKIQNRYKVMSPTLLP